MVIRNLRTKRGWSQEQLAEVSGVSTRTIQRIENGGKASLESLKCLAAVFETPIPDLQKDDDMTHTNDGPNDGLTDEDRAALKYAHNLKAYGERHNSSGAGFDPDMSDAERSVVEHVREMKKFYGMAASFALLTLFLLVINLLTSPGYIWAIWPALGFGISLAARGVKLFGFGGNLGDDWERREIEKRLRRL